jgi:hypothetical protein
MAHAAAAVPAAEAEEAVPALLLIIMLLLLFMLAMIATVVVVIVLVIVIMVVVFVAALHRLRVRVQGHRHRRASGRIRLVHPAAEFHALPLLRRSLLPARRQCEVRGFFRADAHRYRSRLRHRHHRAPRKMEAGQHPHRDRLLRIPARRSATGCRPCPRRRAAQPI